MWLGHVITVIGDRPFRFAVNAEESDGNDTSDPLSLTPLTYIFEDATLHHYVAARGFVVRVSSRLIRRQDEQVSKETHNEAIRFGLRSLVSDPEAREFFLTTESLDNQRAAERLEGQRLRATILRFIWTVNKIWPDQGVGVPDLADNFYNTDDELTDWVRDLERAELLVRKRDDTQFRLGRGQVKMQSFAIHSHPQKQREVDRLIREELQGEVTMLKAFLSYSSRDKKLASSVKEALERHPIDVFMAHDSIRVSQKWMERIQLELKECHVFIAILTEHFKPSDWTDQEAGYAMAYGKKVFPLKLKEDPHGFLSRFQAVTLKSKNVLPACQEIINELQSDPNLNSFFKDATPTEEWS